VDGFDARLFRRAGGNRFIEFDDEGAAILWILARCEFGGYRTLRPSPEHYRSLKEIALRRELLWKDEADGCTRWDSVSLYHRIEGFIEDKPSLEGLTQSQARDRECQPRPLNDDSTSAPTRSRRADDEAKTELVFCNIIHLVHTIGAISRLANERCWRAHAAQQFRLSDLA
jgi:hypothetical protein